LSDSAAVKIFTTYLEEVSWKTTETDRKQMIIFERKVYIRIFRHSI